MKGRKPKLFAVAERDGNTRKRAKKPILPPALGDFDPPFPLDAVARAEWDRLRLEAPWITAASAGLMAMRCATFSDWMRIREEIQASKESDWRLHQRERDAKTYIIRADVELGLTACSAQKVVTPSVPLDAIEAAIG